MTDAKVVEGFHLRVMMGIFVVDFRCTNAELAVRPGVAEMWALLRNAKEGRVLVLRLVLLTEDARKHGNVSVGCGEARKERCERGKRGQGG